MTIKAVIFDFDDTLGNREDYSHRTYIQRIEEVMPDADPWLKETVIQMCLIYDQHGDINKHFVRKRLLETMGIDLGEDIQDYWMSHQCENVVLYPEARSTIEELKARGYLVGVLSNGDSYGQHRKLNRSGIEDLLDVLVVSGDTDTKKPDPKIFIETAEKLGVLPEECIYVGDSFRNDIYGSHLAGMTPVWVWPHGDRYTDLDILRISKLSELLDVLK
ncbi:MAG: HAD family hydrolase [Solobacterium sp.]|nr:HAD family hydrolase [Solobacterium sp.]